MKHWREWIIEHVWLIVIGIILLVNAVLIYVNFLMPRRQPPTNNKPQTTEVAGPVSALTGLPITGVEPRPIAFMIDNMKEARPSSGLPEASIVWETLVEGGVTRLLAVFTTNSETKIGPVRSAREYYLPWVSELGAIYAHSGGSSAALAMLSAGVPNINDANEFFNGAYFKRSVAVSPPHNLFSSTSNLRELATNKNWISAATITPWSSNVTTPANTEAATNITINFSSNIAYRAQWRYDTDKKVYMRSQGGAVAVDRESRQQLFAKNVVVLLANVTPAPRPGVPDAVTVKTIGQGDALLFRDGKVVKGKWSKADVANRTMLTNVDNTPLAITPGNVWIEVVPKDKKDVVNFQ